MSNSSGKSAKKVGIRVYIITIILCVLIAQLFGWAVWYQMRKGQKLGALGNYMVTIAKLPSTVLDKFHNKEKPKPVSKDSPLLIDNPHTQTTNFVKHSDFVDTGYILYSAYDSGLYQSSIKLLSLKTNTVIKTWVSDISKLNSIKNEPKGKNVIGNNSFENIHPILTKDTGLILKVEYKTLYKLNNNSKIEWYLNGNFHHSVEQDVDGNYWIPYSIENSDLDKIKYPGLRDEGISKVSPDGKLLYYKSVIEILLENGYETFLFGVGFYEVSPAHVNDIQPALSNSLYWQKGDLLISIRNRSSVMLYRPSTNKILWLQTGPWLNQHDVSFIDSTKISVFGNDVIRLLKTYKLVRGHNNLYVYDFKTNKITTPYETVFSKYHIHTERSGRAMVLSNNDAYVEETNYGNLMRITASGLVWNYQQIIDEKHIAKISWSRYYTHLPWQ